MADYSRDRSRSRDRYNRRDYDHDRRDSRDYGRDDWRDDRRGGEKENRGGFANYGARIDDRDDRRSGDHYGGKSDGRRDDRRGGGDHYGKKRGRSPPPVMPQNDDALPVMKDDPRINAEGKKEGGKAVKAKGGGRNTESFDPRSTLVRPSMRIVVGPNKPVYDKPLKHDDVVIVPEFFCKEDDWALYYKLVEEMREVQNAESNPDKKGSEWISWHEGAHLISKNPKGSSTYNEIQAKISKYFEIENDKVGTRFNWYRDSSDWKPFHHDSAVQQRR